MSSMTNTYKATSVVGEHYFGEGVSDLDLSVADEQDAIGSGHLVIVPRKYRVLSDNYAAGEKGSVVELALLKEIEAAHMQGGHLERVDAPMEQAPPVDEQPADVPAPKKTSK